MLHPPSCLLPTIIVLTLHWFKASLYIEPLLQRLAEAAVVTVELTLCLRGCQFNRSHYSNTYNCSALTHHLLLTSLHRHLAPTLDSSLAVHSIPKNLLVCPWHALWTAPRSMHRHSVSTRQLNQYLTISCVYPVLHQQCTDALDFHPISLAGQVFPAAPLHPILRPMHQRLYRLFNWRPIFCRTHPIQ